MARQFEVDKLERQRKWQDFVDEMKRAEAAGSAHMPTTGSAGQLTQEQEDELRKRIKQAHLRMEQDTADLEEAQEKYGLFAAALERVREGTGYDNLADVINLFERYEEDKFEKVGATNRVVR